MAYARWNGVLESLRFLALFCSDWTHRFVGLAVGAATAIRPDEPRP